MMFFMTCSAFFTVSAVKRYWPLMSTVSCHLRAQASKLGRSLCGGG